MSFDVWKFGVVLLGVEVEHKFFKITFNVAAVVGGFPPGSTFALQMIILVLCLGDRLFWGHLPFQASHQDSE